MKIKFKIALYYSLSAALLLITFATIAYLFTAKLRREEYIDRLEYRANSIGLVLSEGVQIKADLMLLKKLDQTAFQDLFQETIVVYNPHNYDIVYASIQNQAVKTSQNALDYIKRNKFISYRDGQKEVVGIYHTGGKVPVIVIVSAFDKYGYQNVENLRRVLLIELIVVVVLLVVIGYFFARKMVKPIDQLVQQVNTINANNLQHGQVAVKGKDEIAQLAINFNTMLQRLSDSFDLQKSFVSNASHELRTPLASMISQLQVAAGKERSKEDYQELLQSVLEDAENLSDLTNGLLQLAHSDLNQQRLVFAPVRIDELLLEMHNLVTLKQKQNKIDITFLQVPEYDEFITCNGNESLLKVLFLNLIENACKFSSNKRAEVSIDFDDTQIIVKVIDDGIGIPAEELSKVFEPFYRAQNASQIRGHGLGLSICKKIVLLHKGHISVQSTVGKGTTFEVILPHL